MTLKKIMVTLDGSELAECVLPHVEAFLKAFPNSNVVCVRVVEPIQINLDAEIYSKKKINISAMESERKSAAKDYLATVIERIKGDSSKLNSDVIVGRVAESLTDYAKKNNIDLFIIATHGRSGINRWVRGSIADKIIRSANVPVLMVRAPGIKGGI